MKKIYFTKIDDYKRDRVVIDNEEANSDLFFIEVINYDEEFEAEFSAVVAITKEEALDLANEIIKNVSCET